MNFSAASAANVPASRQKNCDSCVQAKRRCDRRAPVCSRCLEKSIPCVYAKSKKRRMESIAVTPGSSSAAPDRSFLDPGLALDGVFLDHSPVEYGMDFATGTTILSRGGDASMQNFMDLIANNNSPCRGQWIIPLHEELGLERPNTPANDDIARSYQKMAPFCGSIESWQLYDPKTPLHFVTNRVKAFTADMATRNATPFLHRNLYRGYTPTCIVSCFSICVLYTSRTADNTSMVMRALHGAVRELEDAEGGRVIVTPTERLARAQALFLYQVIRLFDGDVSLRAQAERDTPLLLEWLSELCKIRENLGDQPQLEDGSAMKQPHVDWERWIFAESVRRTVVMAFAVLALFQLMKDQEDKDSLDHWWLAHRWTLSRSLWEADSPSEFSRLWQEGRHFVIANFSFEKFLEHGRGEDVDDFAEILLTVYMGVDATREFMSRQGTS